MSELICTIGSRLRDERSRLGLSQTALGEIVGASKRTVIDWEKGATSPTSAQLADLAEIGLDPLYVLVGQRSVARPGLAQEQIAMFNEVIDTFWALSDDSRAIALTMLGGLLRKDVQAEASRSVRKRTPD